MVRVAMFPSAEAHAKPHKSADPFRGRACENNPTPPRRQYLPEPPEPTRHLIATQRTPQSLPEPPRPPWSLREPPRAPQTHQTITLSSYLFFRGFQGGKPYGPLRGAKAGQGGPRGAKGGQGPQTPKLATPLTQFAPCPPSRAPLPLPSEMPPPQAQN